MAGSIFSALSLLLAPRHGERDPAASDATVDGLVFTGEDGRPLPLSSFRGRTLLIVNTASKCGFRRQFEGLESLYRECRERGLVVLGVPTNDFGNQEPGDDAAIFEAYRDGLHLTFPLTGKVRARGPDAHPFFAWAVSVAGPHAAPRWNFYKYLISGDGRLKAWFATPVRPHSRRLRRAVDACLE